MGEKSTSPSVGMNDIFPKAKIKETFPTPLISSEKTIYMKQHRSFSFHVDISCYHLFLYGLYTGQNG